MPAVPRRGEDSDEDLSYLTHQVSKKFTIDGFVWTVVDNVDEGTVDAPAPGMMAFPRFSVHVTDPDTGERRRAHTMGPPQPGPARGGDDDDEEEEEEEEEIAADPWMQHRTTTTSTTPSRPPSASPRSRLTVDESMCAFEPQSSCYGNLPNLSFIIRKPQPLGTELKNAADGGTGLMIHLEIQDGKDATHKKAFYGIQVGALGSIGATAACSFRLMDGTCQDNGLFIGDSWFGSVITSVGVWTSCLATRRCTSSLPSRRTTSSTPRLTSRSCSPSPPLVLGSS